MNAPASRRVAIVAFAVALVALTATASAGSVRADSHDIAIVDFEFKPATLTVFTGEPVAWTNSGAETHTVASVGGSELDSGDLAPQEGYGHVFETPGTYAYHCTIHPDRMNGTVVVQAAPATPVPSGSTEPTPPSGTLPPNFSPGAATGAPPTATPEPTSTPIPSASPGGGPGTSGDNGLPIVVVLAVAIALGAGIAYLLARGRPKAT